MKKFISQLQNSDKFLTIPLLATFFSVTIISIGLLVLLGILPRQVPLFYSLTWGVGQLASKEQLFILPIILILTTLLNFALYSQLHHSQFILKRMLLLSILVVDFIILFAAIKIVFNFV